MRRSILFGVLSLFLVGGVGVFWKGGGQAKWAAKVNGEGVAREDLFKRVEGSKKFYESRYGQEIFGGEAGKENLNRLKTQMLDEMITERILLQEAKSAGFTSAPEGEIENYLETLKKQRGLSDADLLKMTGGSMEDLKEELRREWVISQFIEKGLLKGNPQNGESVFHEWLTKAKAKAQVKTYEKPGPQIAAKASCCKSGCGGGRDQPLDPKLEQEARTKGLEYFEKKTRKKGVGATVTNFGCHIQIDIIENGKIVASLTYNGGEIQEI